MIFFRHQRVHTLASRRNAASFLACIGIAAVLVFSGAYFFGDARDSRVDRLKGFAQETMRRAVWCPVANAVTVTSTIIVSVCGDAQVSGLEGCDDGINNGLYSSTIAGRNCKPGCSAYAPYCGDSILQVLRSEACDDGNNTTGDSCSADCLVAAPQPPPAPPPPPPPPPPGGSGLSGTFFGGSTSGPPPTRVIVSGTAYPGATVTILRDGVILGTTNASPAGLFSFLSDTNAAGTATFGVWAEDAALRRSITFTVTLGVIANAATTISGVYLPPTIDIDLSTLTKGDTLHVFGTTLPGAHVEVVFDGASTMVASSTASGDGAWSALISTAALEDNKAHTAKAFFEGTTAGETIRSGYGRAVTFTLGTGVAPAGVSDLNGDARVNLVDFSILLFHWNTTDAEADLNGDGKVNLTDFSVLLFNWTG
jgi:cysteine-rich repeat protein